MLFQNLRLLALSLIQGVAIVLTFSACTSLSHSHNINENRELTPLEKVFVSTDYELIYRIKELPTAIAAMLLKQAPGIVNPGEPFNSSDVMEPSLSSRQLTWAGISKETSFILYKQGGFAPHQLLLIIELQQGQINSSREFVVPYYIDDIASLKRIILSGKATILKQKN